MSDYKLGVVTSTITLIINIILAMIKTVIGIISGSKAMLADGIHTMSDVVSTIIVLIGLKISSKEADSDHQYGHEKFESVFAKLLSIFLVLTGSYIGYEAFKSLSQGNIVKPKFMALVAAVVSIIVKEIMYRYTMRAAKKTNSISMEADAWHHRSDALSSLGTFIGILGARLGFTILDPIAGIIVSILIIKVGIDIYIKSIRELVDESASTKTINDIKSVVYSIEGVRGIKSLKTRIFGNKIYVDLEIYVASNITVREGHDISEDVHDVVEDKVEKVKHCMVHIEPYDSL
ncbi:MAG TPA: cation diffusion facilitator family transporter [Tissierellaceae bacterium]|nr:cation diffusion facilitator family transporter [Tissierellaceae bacterium]